MRNVQFNWERSLIKNATQFTSYILFFYASSITNVGLQNQPSDWWSPFCGNDIF